MSSSPQLLLDPLAAASAAVEVADPSFDGEGLLVVPEIEKAAAMVGRRRRRG